MRWIKWTLLTLVLLPALWFGLVLTQWLPRLSEEQRSALALVEQVRVQPLGQRNAYPLLWLFDYDVPVDRLDAVMAEDLIRFADYAQTEESGTGYVSIAAERYAKLPTVDPLDRAADSCYGRGGGCLAEVRAAPEAVAEELKSQPGRLAREALLSDYDHVSMLFPRTLSAPLALDHGTGGIVRTAAALDHVNGSSADGLQRLCEHTAAWRRLRSNTDNLITDMVGQVAIYANADLAAEILAERPDLDQLSCLSAFDPLSDTELDQCAAMIGEHGYQVEVMDDIDRHLDSGLEQIQRRMINLEHTLAISAMDKVYYCQAAHQQRIAARNPTPAPPENKCSVMAKAFNPIGCILAAIAQPTFDPYYRRTLDLDARLRLFQTARWLRANDDGSALERQLTRLPDALRSPAHAYSYDETNDEIRAALLIATHADYWAIPVRREPPASAASVDDAL